MQSIIYFFFVPILSGLIEISVYSCGELRKAGSERKIDMKKLVVILAIAIMLFPTQEQRTGQSSVATQGTPLNTAAVQAEKVPETNTEQVERITEAASEPIPTKNKAATKRVSIRGREAKNYSLAGGSSVISMGAYDTSLSPSIFNMASALPRRSRSMSGKRTFT
jgi:hypothetical protein